MKIIKIIFLIVIIIISAFFIFKNKKEEIIINNNEVIIIDEPLVVLNSFETKTIKEGDQYTKFDIKYPKFNKAPELNSELDNFIKERMVEHKDISKENWQARYETGDDIQEFPSDDEKFVFYCDFDVVQSNSSYISFVLKYGGYTGGAHGYEVKLSYAYDLKNNKYLELKDLFNDPNYLTYVSEESRKSLINQYIEKAEEEGEKEYFDSLIESINLGTEPKVDNFKSFTFTKDKVKIYFSQYQVGPYAIGMPEVEVVRK